MEEGVSSGEAGNVLLDGMVGAEKSLHEYPLRDVLLKC